MAKMVQDINVNTLTNKLVLKINLKGIKQFRIRIFIAKILLRLSAKVIGCDIKIDE